MAKHAQLGQTGRIGENVAVTFLKSKSYEILATNVTYSFGELDIVAKKLDTIYFIEVKAANINSMMQVALSERMGVSKLNRIKRSIQMFVEENNYYKNELQIDLLLVQIDHLNKVAKIKHIQNVY